MLHSLRATVGRASAVPAIVNDAFENGCLYLLTEAFKRLRNAGEFDLKKWNENQFSAHLILYMEIVRDEEDVLIQIDPECYQYYVDVLRGNFNPDKSPRIDIRIKGGWVQRDVHYAIEAKVLVENNWSTRNANKLHNRYIDTGIDNFVKGRYSPVVPKGCVLGYVLQGKACNIVVSINDKMTHRMRNSEILKEQHSINGCKYCWKSMHKRITDKQALRLYHVLLVFC